MGNRHCIVKGRVQGVGFRYFTFRAAKELGIKGWVRNLGNGDVEVQAQGEDAVLELFVDRLREGPPASSVDDIQLTELHQQEYDDFSIER